MSCRREFTWIFKSKESSNRGDYYLSSNGLSAGPVYEHYSKATEFGERDGLVPFVALSWLAEYLNRLQIGMSL